MSTPDPQTARNFARRAILATAEDVDFMGIAEQFSDDENWPADEADAEAMHDAVYAQRRMAIVTVSWPDEQQAADPVISEQQQDEAAGRILAYLDDHRARYPYDATGVIADLPAAYDNGLLPLHELLEADLRAVLAERDSLALRIAKLKSQRTALAVLLLAEPDERVADTRAVRGLLMALIALGDRRPAGLERRANRLRARFADRIATLDGD